MPNMLMLQLTIIVSRHPCLARRNISALPYIWLLKTIFLGLILLSHPAQSASSIDSASQLTTYNLTHQGKLRQYRVYEPKGYKSKGSMPAVLVFHGGFGNAVSAMRQSRITAKANKEGFIVVFPEAIVGPASKLPRLPYKHWNGGPRRDKRKAPNVDDVGFIRAMLDKLTKEYNLDTKRIYAVGISNGGTMVYRLACQLSDRIAAIASIAATQLDIPCHPTRPVSIIHFHGLRDRYIPFNGGISEETKDHWPSVPRTINAWVKRNQCSGIKKQFYKKGKAKCISYGKCKAGTEVILCQTEKGGHTWPGGSYQGYPICRKRPNGLLCNLMKKRVGIISSYIHTNDLMWKFFRGHPFLNKKRATR